MALRILKATLKSIFLKTGHILAVIPWFFVKKGVLEEQTPGIIYKYIVWLIQFIQVLCMHYEYIQINLGSVIVKTFITLNALAVSTCVLVIISSNTYSGVTNWKRLSIALIFSRTTISKRNEGYFDNTEFPLKIFFINAAFLSSLIYEIMYYSSQYNVYLLVVDNAARYMVFYYSLLATYNSIAFTLRFEYLCKALNKILQTFSLEVQSIRKLENELKSARKVYGILIDGVEAFNSIFGYFFVLYTLSVFTRIVGCIYLTMELKLANGFILELFLMFFMSPVLMMIFFFHTILCFDDTMMAANKLRRICYQMQDNSFFFFYESKAKKELIQLINITKHCPAKFTAANFFDMDKMTILKLTGITVTYLTVILQLNVNFFKHR